MVGFIGEQYIMSGGLLVESSSTSTVLNSGIVITVYLGSASGVLRISSFNPTTNENTVLTTIGSFAEGYKIPTVMALENGGFSIIMEEDTTPSNHNQISLLKFTANGTQVGTTTILDSGYLMEMQNAIKTDVGYFVAYRDRETGAEVQYGGHFFDEDGNFLKTYDFQEGRAINDFPRAHPNFTALDNGNIAAVWKKTDTDGTFVQVFRPNGNTVGDAFLVSEEGVTYDQNGTAEIQALDGGGFALIYQKQGPILGRDVDPDIIYIQKYKNNGDKDGSLISFDTKIDGVSVGARQLDIGFTEDGLIAVSFSGTVPGTSDDNVYLTILSPKGNVVFGPSIANAASTLDQNDGKFIKLADGSLILTFFDDQFVQFQYQDSIQGIKIVAPDWFWEGTADADARSGTSGNDVMIGLAGDDVLRGNAGDDYIRGNDGNDSVDGAKGQDELFGEAGEDILNGGQSADILYGGQDNDTLNGGAGDDFLFGGVGNDSLFGARQSDSIYGGDGEDSLVGFAGTDRLYGGLGDDTQFGGGGDDTLYGEDGDDDLSGGKQSDRVEGGIGNDKVAGDAGNDYLFGGDGNDTLTGGGGNDILNGGKGDDVERGNAGSDTFYDNDGNDIIFGGGGADNFIFQDTDFGHDVIRDFQFGLDTLDMGLTAFLLNASSRDPIQIMDTAEGVLFSVDIDHSVLVLNANLSDFQDGDYIVNSPF